MELFFLFDKLILQRRKKTQKVFSAYVSRKRRSEYYQRKETGTILIQVISLIGYFYYRLNSCNFEIHVWCFYHFSMLYWNALHHDISAPYIVILKCLRESYTISLPLVS